MVSFQCDGCADTVKKPKLDQHRQRCWASFTCLDCSKTFQNQEYKSHTSCISEAEKYQGALYRGPKKGQAQPTPAAPAAPAAVTTPLDSAASSPAPPAIHPSRLNQFENGGSDSSFGHSARGGPSGRGGAYGRGGRGGRGGYGAAAVQSAPPRGRGKLVSGENTRAPETGMRSWGSPAVIDDSTDPSSSAPTAPASAPTVSVNGSVSDDKKKRKKKGDKGGTGSKANSKRPKDESDASATATTAGTTDVTMTTPVNGASDEPAAKKRKRSEEPATTAVVAAATSAEISDKTLKRLRKNASKVGEKAASPLALSEWLKQVGEGKKEQVDLSDVNRAAKVSFEDGKWVLSF